MAKMDQSRLLPKFQSSCAPSPIDTECRFVEVIFQDSVKEENLIFFSHKIFIKYIGTDIGHFRILVNELQPFTCSAELKKRRRSKLLVFDIF